MNRKSLKAWPGETGAETSRIGRGHRLINQAADDARMCAIETSIKYRANKLSEAVAIIARPDAHGRRGDMQLTSREIL